MIGTRTLFTAVLSLAVPLSAALLPQAASAQTVLTMSSWVPPNHAITIALGEWGKELEKASNGRLKFNMLPKPPAAAPGTFDAVRDGLVDISFVTASYTPARHVLPKLPELPGGGSTAEINSVAYQRIHMKHLDKAGEYKGVKLLAVFTHGPGQMYNVKRPIAKVDDLAGLKIRTGGGIADEMARALGASAFVKPAPESYELLSSGVADGTFFPLEAVDSFKLDRVVKYVTLFPGGLYNSALAFFMNEEKFNKLSKQDQDVIMSFAGEKVARFFGQAWDGADKRGMAAIKAAGVNITEAPPELVKGVQQRTASIEQDWIKAANAKGIDGAKALADFREEVKKVTAGK